MISWLSVFSIFFYHKDIVMENAGADRVVLLLREGMRIMGLYETD